MVVPIQRGENIGEVFGIGQNQLSLIGTAQHSRRARSVCSHFEATRARHKRSGRLFDHLVGRGGEAGRGGRQTIPLAVFRIYGPVRNEWLLDGQLGRLRSFADFHKIVGRLPTISGRR